MLKTIALLGGTFDPVHNGHLQSALELKQRLALDELRLMPCHLPPHRQSPGCDSWQRLAMVKLALADTALLVDDRELQREGVSYTVETLEQLRLQLNEQELDKQVALIWVMGSDAFSYLESWHRWQELTNFAHIVVIARPGEQRPLSASLSAFVERHRAMSATVLQQQPAGFIWFETLTPYAISATEIRQKLAEGAAVEDYLPAAVLNYIYSHQLYTG